MILIYECYGIESFSNSMQMGGMDLAVSAIRSGTVDALKGYAILLVILGHSIQSFIPDFDNDFMFRFIYSFHMPLFMFLSGYVTSFSKDLSIKKKFVRLAVPFVSWYLLTYWIAGIYHSIKFYDYIIRWIKSPDYGLWFLWILFLCYGVLAISLRLEKYMSKELALLLIYCVIYLTPLNIIGFGLGGADVFLDCFTQPTPSFVGAPRDSSPQVTF